MGLILIVIGLILLLATTWNLIGIICIIVGVILLFAPGPFYGYNYYRGRRAPPP